MRMRMPAFVMAVLVSACGSGAVSGPHPAGGQWAPVPLPHARQPAISGGTAAQRALLREILQNLRPTGLRSLEVRRVDDNTWGPFEPGDVELHTAFGTSPAGGENVRGAWETWIVGGAFRDRSRMLGLPRVVVVSSPLSASRAQHEGIAKPPAGGADMAGFRERVQQAVALSGARLVTLRTGIPDGLTADISIQTSRPAYFLSHRLRGLENAIRRIESDGVFIDLYDIHGREVYVSGSGRRLGTGVTGVHNPRYEGCVPGCSTPPNLTAAPLCRAVRATRARRGCRSQTRARARGPSHAPRVGRRV